MSAEEGAVTAAVRDRANRHLQRRSDVATAAIWLLGSAVVALAQPDSDRRLAAAGAAVAGIATILAVSRLTPDPERRHFRSLVGAMVAVSVVGDWLIQHLAGNANGFVQYGVDTRIALPLLFVLLAPLVLRALPTRLGSHALWRDRAVVWREARPLDWLAAAYALLIVPDLALGLAHHAPKTYIAQDLGLIVFFVFAYVAGRTVSAKAGRASAVELVVVLLALGSAQALFGWDTTPIFTYVEAASAGAVAFALLQPTKARLVLLAAAVALLANDAVAIKNGTGSTTSFELAAALGVVGYLVVRARNLLPRWLCVAIAVAALAAFLAFTSDGATVRGQYYGSDQSNLGRTYEAHQVRAAVHGSPVSFVFGRGLGGSVDETDAPPLFAASLVYGGRDLAHVQQVHLLPYDFLLKNGLLGFAWLAALAVGLAVLGIRALETASRHRDPTPVVYAALPLLGLVAALAAATHLQDNPLNAFALGVLVTRLDGTASFAASRLRFAVPATAVICAAVGAVAFSGRVGPFVFPGFVGGGMNAAVVGDLRLNYPYSFHRRYFSTAKHAITGAHGIRIHGIVVASYPLTRSPELGGAGASFRRNGVFLELYRAPRLRHRLAPTRPFPLTIFDLPDIGGLPGAREQGGTSFSVNGRNYRVILWVGTNASKLAQVAAEEIVTTIDVK
ncbi:MAG: hypothetical protein ACJ75G_00880 [Gaiellaceae bacterium]